MIFTIFIKKNTIDTRHTHTYSGIKATASREQPKVSELVQPDILFDKLINTVKGAASTTPAIPGSKCKRHFFLVSHLTFL